MMGDIIKKEKKKWALILGGSSGLGLASAKKLASHGFNIIVVHRDRKSDLDRIKRDFDDIMQLGVGFFGLNQDAVHPDKRTQLLAGIKEKIGADGEIQILVHSIAKGNLKPMRSDTGKILDHQDFKLTLDAMALSLYDWTQMLVQERLFSPDSRIISFTSEGNIKAWPNYAAVSTAKVALESITRNIALEFAPLGIKANCIQAGMTETPSFHRIPGSKELKEHTLMRNPHGRLTTPEDVANVVYLLSREEAKWITGTVIKVDGGEHLS